MKEYRISKSESRFLSLFRRFRVETLWVEVRKREKDYIPAFIYVPSTFALSNRKFIYKTKLTKIAPVYTIAPVPALEDAFIFEAYSAERDKTLSFLINKQDLIDFINNDWEKEFLISRLKQRARFPASVILPSNYSQTEAKRLYSKLHYGEGVKKDAYMFDVDVALLERDNGELDFVSLLEYKTGRELSYQKDYLTYNEIVGYRFLSKLYRTLLVVGERSFKVYNFTGDDRDYIGSVSQERLEDFLREAIYSPSL